MLELYYYLNSTCSQKVKLCLAEKKLEWTGRHVSLPDFEQLKPNYLKLNPNGVVPTLVHDGRPVLESTMINEYLDDVFPETRLRPKDPYELARLRAWSKHVDDVVHPAVRVPTFAKWAGREAKKRSEEELEAITCRMPSKEAAERWRKSAKGEIGEDEVAAAVEKLEKTLSRMEEMLAGGPYLLGEFSLADVNTFPYILRMEHLFLADAWKEKPKVRAWIDRMKARPSFKEMFSLKQEPWS